MLSFSFDPVLLCLAPMPTYFTRACPTMTASVSTAKPLNVLKLQLNFEIQVMIWLKVSKVTCYKRHTDTDLCVFSSGYRFTVVCVCFPGNFVAHFKTSSEPLKCSLCTALKMCKLSWDNYSLGHSLNGSYDNFLNAIITTTNFLIYTLTIILAPLH